MRLSASREKKIKQFIPKHSGSSAIWWALQRVSGFFVFVFVFLHMLVNHYLTALIDTGSVPELSKGIASFEAVAWKMTNPYYFWLSVLFVAFLMIHVLNGIRMIVLDVATGHSFRKFFGIILFLVGVLIVIYAITFNSLVVLLG